MDNSNQINVSTNGIATPLKMSCEYQVCQCEIGRDYKDPNKKGVWKDEPTFLCDKHAELLQLRYKNENKSPIVAK